MLTKEQEISLISDALAAREKAYAPYSGFGVGSAVITQNGTVYTGCNIENGSYGATNCAERTAIFKAVSEGERDFVAIAIVGMPFDQNQDSPFPEYAYPCGMCRQVMAEFCKKDFQIIVAKSTRDYLRFTLKDLLPYSFT